MSSLRAITILMLVILAIITLATLMLGGFMPVFSVASGLLFLYYLALFLGIKFAGNSAGKAFVYGFSILFIIPIVLFIIDAEGMINFLMQGIHLDMR